MAGRFPRHWWPDYVYSLTALVRPTLYNGSVSVPQARPCAHALTAAHVVVDDRGSGRANKANLPEQTASG